MRLGQDRYVTQREFDVLRTRVDQMDQQGTRGVGSLAVRMDEIVKDFAEAKVDQAKWQADHLKLHEKEVSDAKTTRRYILTTCLTILSLVIAVLAISVGHLIWH